MSCCWAMQGTLCLHTLRAPWRSSQEHTADDGQCKVLMVRCRLYLPTGLGCRQLAVVENDHSLRDPVGSGWVWTPWISIAEPIIPA